MNPGPFRIGEIVWAKVKGYPQWPALVLDPREGVDVKNSRKKNSYFVRFFSADDRVQVSWMADEDLVTFPLILSEMKTASEMKGGKTYLDLRKCITSANQAHTEFMEKLELDPDAALQLAIAPTFAAGGEAAGTSTPRGRPKKETARSPATATSKQQAPDVESAAQPQTPATGKRTRPSKPPAKATPEPAPAAEATPSKRVPKKRTHPDDEYGHNGFSTPASGTKRKTAGTAGKTASLTEPRKSAVKSEVKEDYGTVGLPMQTTEVPKATLNQARAISVGFIGLEDVRAVQAAKRLLNIGVAVRVWAKTQLLSKDLEYSGAERISEAEKIFEETDVVFVSAGSSYDLNDLLSGADHLIRKIRPQGKNKVKGVCVFSSMSKQDSELTAHKLEAKNIKYLECAWAGHAERPSLICCRSEELYKHCKPVLDIVCGQSVFLGHDFGTALAAKSYLSIVEGVHLAGLVEAGFLAQSTGLDVSLVQPLLSFKPDERVARILKLPEDPQNVTGNLMREQYRGLRDAVHLAHPVQDGVLDNHSSVTHMASFAMDLFKTHFIMYRCQRETDEDNRAKKLKSAAAAGAPRSGTEAESSGGVTAAKPTAAAISAPVNGVDTAKEEDVGAEGEEEIVDKQDDSGTVEEDDAKGPEEEAEEPASQ
ncbi:cytokine-like nuclear factor N-PAC [Paramacrobiotus metropolitanus]|uniref:cytokine-like nuclear factor N-PAC n=1 Tax=Paramacrobiotus metropolitanus TaxID=2943436 RepID=UPI0024463B77|nr:cytokine-like nuclear factor N-PAC [Paramacrobiotus metropolitanus]